MQCGVGLNGDGGAADPYRPGDRRRIGGVALDEMLGELRRTMMERAWAGVAIGGLAGWWWMRVEKLPG